MVRGGGLEPPRLRIRPSNVRVYQFHHPRAPELRIAQLDLKSQTGSAQKVPSLLSRRRASGKGAWHLKEKGAAAQFAHAIHSAGHFVELVAAHVSLFQKFCRDISNQLPVRA